MTHDGPRPNFFAILGLDPRAPWDQRAYVSALDEKKRQWSKRRSGIKTHPATVEAQRNLALVRDIERVMLDTTAREEERKAAIAAVIDERRQRATRIAKRVDRMLAKGFLYDVEYEALKDDLQIADEAAQRRVEAAEKRPVVRARKDNERLDQAKERNLRDYMAIVGETDLYAVLRSVDPDIGSESAREDLYAAADKLYQRARNTADKDRPEVGARQNLAGIAREIFSSDELVRRYQLSMRLAPLDAIVEQYEQDLALVRAVDARQFEMFLRDAAALGVDVALAKEVFIGHFRERNWSVEVPGTSTEAALKALVSCPRCAELNEPEAKHCAQCGSSLTASCPRRGCGGQVPVEALACPRCGFRVGERDYAEYLAEEAGTFLARDDALNAADALRRADQAWPLGPESDDPLAVRLRQLHEQLEPVREGQQRAIEQISFLMESRSYRAARRQLRELPFSTTATGEMLQRCEDAVRESEQKLREARRPGIPDERKAVLYLEALDRCADNSEARRELEQLPPGPPRRLRAEPDLERRVVRLTWEPAPDVGCSSVVVRTDGPVPPASAQGHHRHVVRRRGRWEDRDPLVGRPMWYAIYTERDGSGTLSEHAEVTAEPVLLAAEPQLTARQGNHEVKLTWTVPENALQVEIQREEIATGRLVRFPSADNGTTRRIDGNVRNEAQYRYTARAVYTYQVPGRPPAVRYSAEVTREVVPAAPPAPPGPVRARGYPPLPDMDLYLQKVKLEWPQTEQGEVRIVRSRVGHPMPASGVECAEDELGRYGQVVRGHEYIWMPGRDRVCYFTPVLVLNGQCYAGKARPYAVGPEVGDVRAEQAGTSVNVTWTWPDGVDEALVAWDDENEVADPVAAQLQTMVRRADSAANGEYDIPVGSVRRIFVQVAAVVREGGAEFFTSGVGTSVQRRTINVAYEVRRGRGQKGRLILRPNRPTHLPALVLLGRTDDRPAGRDDRLIKRIPPGHADPGTVVDVHLDKVIRPSSCRLFTEDDAEILKVIHPQRPT